MTFDEAMVEVEVELACAARRMPARVRADVLSLHRQVPPDSRAAALAACVISHAMMYADKAPAERDRLAVRDGNDQYALMLADRGDLAGWNRPTDPLNWLVELVAACDAAGMADEDAAYALAELRRSDGWALAWWVELAGFNRKPGATGDWCVRAGCRRYAESRLWLRDHQPFGPDLAPYVAVG